ncbi:hypothetical protein RJ639_030641 [Escallonia herrerae]|uniref:Fungal lipase-type domain-containing protein n=1 Tax=Escallonia herrerae TaxID=1293975 RepID=A0AA89BH15_9ASTE|nr:hypothetical protein RJ639_030641 [Escallonia herrerae]
MTMASQVLNMPNPNMNFVASSSEALLRPCSLRRVVPSPVRQGEIYLKRQSLTVSEIKCRVKSFKVSSTRSCLARLWREVQGLNNWENLVEPLDPLLQQEIIRYGEFVTACYKAFDLDQASKRFLNCKYGKKSLLREVGLADSGYEVTKYIYATPDINLPIQNDACSGRWIGYVAVSSDDEVKRLGRRDIVISFRGTVTCPEWIANLMSSLTPARLDPFDSRPDVKVEAGFLSLYTSNESSTKFGVGSCREQLLCEVSRILSKYKGEEVSITLAGHSMGSSIALLLAYDIAELGLNRRDDSDHVIPLTVFSFGGPRVGNSGFKERCEELGVKVLRIVNTNDPVTKLPGVFLNENFRVLGGRYEFPWSCSCYAHVGVELALEFFKMGNPSCVHDLETYLNLLKYPRRAEVENEGMEVLNRAKELVLSVQNFKAYPCIDATLSAVNMVLDEHLSFLISLFLLVDIVSS